MVFQITDEKLKAPKNATKKDEATTESTFGGGPLRAVEENFGSDFNRSEAEFNAGQKKLERLEERKSRPKKKKLY